MSRIRFVNPDAGDFQSVLRARVENYFIDNNISPAANGYMIFRIIFFIGILAGSYLLLIFGNFSFPVSMLLWVVLGLFCAFTGVNVCHDAIHGSLFKNKTLNKIFSYFFNLVGANAYLWTIMHNSAHHTYTNIEGHDEDLETTPALRMSPHQQHKKMHRYQHMYAFFFYSLASLSWVFVKDYKKFFQKNIGGIERKHPKSELFNLLFSKLLYYYLFIVLPFMVLDFHWSLILLGFITMHIVQGLTIAIIFVLAHVVEETHFPLPENNRINANWAEHQLRTTANFATDDFFACFFTGGLNFQVEHHLFPLICHVHYPAVSKIVEKTAKEYNIPYNNNPTFFGALGSHIRLLKKFGAGASHA